MICPVMPPFVYINYYNNPLGSLAQKPRECERENCAWWVKEFNGCALSLIAIAQMEGAGYIAKKADKDA